MQTGIRLRDMRNEIFLGISNKDNVSSIFGKAWQRSNS